MVPGAALATISFDVNSVTEKLTTHNYQDLAFCGTNNNDFIAYYNQSPIASISFPLPAGRWRCCEYSDCSKNETWGGKLFITASSMGFWPGVPFPTYNLPGIDLMWTTRPKVPCCEETDGGV